MKAKNIVLTKLMTALVIELKALENQYPELKLEDSPTLDITDEPHSVFPSRKHLIPMLSLGNVYSLERT